MSQWKKPQIKTLIASNTVTSTGSSTNFAIPICDVYSFFLDVTAASGTSPTLDMVYQTSIDGGTTYRDIPWRHTQITTTGTNYLTVRLGLGIGEAGVEGAVADTGGTLKAPFVVDVDHMKVKYTLTATTPSFTWTLYVFCLDRVGMAWSS